jgi:hypothetical protein
VGPGPAVPIAAKDARGKRGLIAAEGSSPSRADGFVSPATLIKIAARVIETASRARLALPPMPRSRSVPQPAGCAHPARTVKHRPLHPSLSHQRIHKSHGSQRGEKDRMITRAKIMKRAQHAKS